METEMLSPKKSLLSLLKKNYETKENTGEFQLNYIK